MDLKTIVAEKFLNVLKVPHSGFEKFRNSISKVNIVKTRPMVKRCLCETFKRLFGVSSNFFDQKKVRTFKSELQVSFKVLKSAL